eukprot:CAMPEP_0202887080 /NCGR_PEP_ID=MMETSP1391-20130828/42497_1 /ASSEMBLY_ACC=CAM_ASM_000867 /TAXON_ID=1034604 /ORGANISM="Chlamydomonas leiostraca, Strain SAG 11-49" /LENGTH=208 /DNA_ID=CAMNT_0049570355 /DNA_START=456 /DNA_END=1082 /DNA_ORIENTATION=+
MDEGEYDPEQNHLEGEAEQVDEQQQDYDHRGDSDADERGHAHRLNRLRDAGAPARGGLAGGNANGNHRSSVHDRLGGRNYTRVDRDHELLNFDPRDISTARALGRKYPARGWCALHPNGHHRNGDCTLQHGLRSISDPQWVSYDRFSPYARQQAPPPTPVRAPVPFNAPTPAAPVAPPATFGPAWNSRYQQASTPLFFSFQIGGQPNS